MSLDLSGPIHRKRVHEEVAARLEQLISAGTISPGDRFPPERELMRLFGVGRSAIREGLLLLQQRGLVRVSTGERAQVTLPNASRIVKELGTGARLLLAQPGGILNFQNARALIEIGLARHAAMHGTPDDIAELHRILQANKEVMNDQPKFIMIDLEFHFYLARMAGNALVAALHAALIDWLKEQREVSGRAPGAAEIAYAGHENIYRAIEARDPLAAQAAMEAHLSDVARRYWQMAGC